MIFASCDFDFFGLYLPSLLFIMNNQLTRMDPCWWRMLETRRVCLIVKMLISMHFCHQNLYSVTNIESPISRCHQHQYCRFRLIKSHFCWEVWKRQGSKSKDQNFWSTRIDDLKFRKNWKNFKTQIFQTSRE